MVDTSKNYSAESVIAELIWQAEKQGQGTLTGYYLVGALLTQVFGNNYRLCRIEGADSRYQIRGDTRTTAYLIGGAVIQVAVGLPDDAALSNLIRMARDSKRELWLLTRKDRVDCWKAKMREFHLAKVVVTSIEGFIGQTITGLAAFDPRKKCAKLQELFDLYNEDVVASLGPPGIRIEVK